MTTKIIFTTSIFDGLTAELYDTSFSPFLFFAPDATDTIQNGVASFNIAPPNPFAVRVVDGGGILRTGFQSQDVGEVDANGDFSASFLAMNITDPADTTISLATLTAGINLPISEGDLTVTSLNVTAVPPNLRASGAGTYSAGALGNIPISYTYDFSLDPVDSALSSRIVDVQTINTTVTGTSGGLLGWLINAIVGLISILFNDTISEKIEEAVQAEVDAAVDDAFAAAGAPDEAFATLRSVTVTGGDVVIDPWVAIPLSALDCASFISSGSVRIRDRKQLRKLRLMRDKALAGTPQGDAYIKLLQQHSPELLRILAARPQLLKAVDRLVAEGLEEFDEEAPGKGVLKPRTAKMAQRIMDEIAEDASPRLRRSIELARKDVEQFAGRPVSQVLEENTAAARKLVRKDK